MSKTMTTTLHCHSIRRLVLISGLIVLLFLLLPVATLAAPPPPIGAEKCAECHSEETGAWQDSPHANAVGNEEGVPGATCEACHGAYVEDHPEAGVMQLTVDSSICEDCHASTFGQWRDSIHAQAGVQCIGCHLSHSQGFRLSDEALCASCHRDWLDTVHGELDVGCIDCHVASTASHEIVLASSDESSNVITAPSHDFTASLSRDCVKCHGEEIHKEDMAATTNVRALVTPECEPKLVAKLETVEQTNRSLQTMTPVSLGLGMGIGGMLGIIFMLVINYINQGRGRQ